MMRWSEIVRRVKMMRHGPPSHLTKQAEQATKLRVTKSLDESEGRLVLLESQITLIRHEAEAAERTARAIRHERAQREDK